MTASLITLPGTGEKVITHKNASDEHGQGVVLLRSDNLEPVTIDASGQKVYLTVALPAGDANIGNVDVVTLPALPAGTNAIGKLAANSGVDIGDVDVTSLPALPAGANDIGEVHITNGTNTAEVDANGSLQTSIADSAGTPLGFDPPSELTANPSIGTGASAQYDSLHTTIMTFNAAAGGVGGTGRILGARLVCKHDTFAGTIALHLFRKSVTGTTAQDALAVSDTDKLEMFGTLTFDFSTALPLGGGRVATANRAVLPLDYKCDAGTDDIFGILQLASADTPTFAAADLVPFLTYIAD